MPLSLESLISNLVASGKPRAAGNEVSLKQGGKKERQVQGDKFHDRINQLYKTLQHAVKNRPEFVAPALTSTERQAGSLLTAVLLQPKSDSARKAFNYIKAKADIGLAHSMYQLGQCYLWGCGVRADKAEAFRWFDEAASEGHARAQFMVGLFLQDKLLDDVEERKKPLWMRYGPGISAKAFFKGASGRNAPLADLALSIDSGDSQKARKALAVMDKGDPIAMYYEGICHFRGIGVEQSDNKAVELWKESAKFGYWGAQWAVINYRKEHPEIDLTEDEVKNWTEVVNRMSPEFAMLGTEQQPMVPF